MPVALVAHDSDPKTVLTDKIGDVSGVEVLHNQVLLAIYIAPDKTAGGIIVPRDEDRHQSKVGLILKTGPKAFAKSAEWSWPDDMGVGDWVYLRRSDGWNVTVNSSRDNLCLQCDDVDIRGRIPNPDQIW